MFVERTLVLGANSEGIAVADQLRQNRASGALILGFVADSRKAGDEPVPALPVLGGSKDFAKLVREHEVDSVVVADPSILRENLMADDRALATLRNVEIQMAWGAFELLTTGLRIREEGFVPLVVLNKTRISGVHWLLKEILDRLCSLLALLLLSVPLLILAILIKLDSRGPVFFRRRVAGVGRREFDAFKLRTMRVEGNALLSEEQKQEWRENGKIKDDPRITKLGEFLRRYSIDELPQLLNVLRGEMSIVGPRMLTVAELDKFGQWQHSLLTVKPGLTGLWQVSGRSDLTYEDRVRLDLHYIRNHTIWLDLQILVQTVPAVLHGRGAY
jgi:exopolysaccharide biosynthesis polyprenyl glycosylphosphotransferase